MSDFYRGSVLQSKGKNVQGIILSCGSLQLVGNIVVALYRVLDSYMQKDI